MKRYFALIPLIATIALANGSRLTSMDSYAVARGYAFIATADNASAIYYNPAGLGLLKQTEITHNFYVVTPQYSVERRGVKTNATATTFVTPSVFAAKPMGNVFGLPLTIGVGFYSPFGLGTKWPEATGFRTHATENSVRYLTGAITAATTITPGLQVGFSVQGSNNHTDLSRGLGMVPHDRFRFVGNDTAPSFNLGVIWQPSTNHSFGLTYQSITQFKLHGDVSMQPMGITYSGSGHWVYPDNIAFGYSYRPNARWNFEVNYDWTNWDRVNTVTLNSGRPPISLPFNWKASAYTSVGATYSPNKVWFYSMGMQYSPNSVPGSSFSPALPDTRRKLYNAGVGKRLNHRWEVTSVIQLSPTETRTVTGLPPSPAGETVNGIYRAYFWAVGLGLKVKL